MPVNKRGGGYIYIVQASLDPTRCKIGITNNLEQRLRQYSNRTGQSKANIWQYLFTCEVKDMQQVENDIKNRFLTLREQNNREVYFYNPSLFNDYIGFIKSHELFVKEIFIKPPDKQQITKIVQRTKPTMKERGVTWRKVLQKAQNVKNDEFYTRYEDIEKEINMYPPEIW